MNRRHVTTVGLGMFGGMLVVLAASTAAGALLLIRAGGEDSIDAGVAASATGTSTSAATLTPGPPTLLVEFDVKGEHLTDRDPDLSSDVDVRFLQPDAGVERLLRVGDAQHTIELLSDPFAVVSRFEDPESGYGGYVVTFGPGCGTQQQPIEPLPARSYACRITLVPWASVRITYRVEGGDLGIGDFKVEVVQPEQNRVRGLFGNSVVDLPPHNGPWEVRRGTEPARSTVGYDFALEGDCAGEPILGRVFECTVIRTVNSAFEQASPPGWTPEPAPTPAPSVERAVATVITEGLRLRSGAGVDRPLVRVLERGEELDIIGRHPNREWLAVAREGWVFYSPDWLDLDAEVLALFPVAAVWPDAIATGQDPQLRWGFDTRGSERKIGALETAPAVSDGIAYVGSGGITLWALNASSGQFVWKFLAGRRVMTSPAIEGFFVYVGDFAGTLYAVSTATGRERWRFEAGDQINGAPVFSNGLVYVGSRDHYVYALDAESGAEAWCFEALGPVILALAVDESVVYVASLDHLYALDAATGVELWRHQARAHLSTGPVVGEGAIHFATTGHELHALSPATRQTVWIFETGATTRSRPELVDGVLYFGSDGGFVYAVVAASGEEHWRFETRNVVSAEPLVTDEVLYVGGTDGRMYAIDIATGNQRWRIDSGGLVTSRAALHDDVLVYPLNGGLLRALELP